MAAKLYAVFLLTAIFAQANTDTTELQTVNHEDVEVNYEINPFFAGGFGINKFMFDTLHSCHVTFPNGVTYEAFPNNNLPDGTMTLNHAAVPFQSCSVTFRDPALELSGTYTLAAITEDWQTGVLTLSTQTFHLTILESSVIWPSK